MPCNPRKADSSQFERQQYLMLSCQSTAKVDDNKSNVFIVQCATSFMFHCKEEGDPSTTTSTGIQIQ